MSQTLLKMLVEDADLVADVGVRLGRIKSVEFLTALSKARQALDNNSASPEVIAELQKWLNSVVNDISPITLNDLRAGWRPFNAHMQKGLGTLVFGFFCLLLLVSTAYMTQIYDRARSLYDTTLELQEMRGAEETIKLFGLLRKNQQDVIESLTTGNKDFLYEVFNKALFDLQLMNIKFQAYRSVADKVIKDLDIYKRITDPVHTILAWLRDKGNAENTKLAAENTKLANENLISEWTQNYGKLKQPRSPVGQTNGLAQGSATELKDQTINSLLNIYFADIRSFRELINVNFDPLVPTDFSFYLNPLRGSMSILGSWVLPCLYGMLGAVLFHMRRLLEPTLPNPAWLRFAHRIVLGGFAGIIVAWFWTPSSLTLTEPPFAPLTSFGLAFLVGFSTDVFLQGLDRLVNSMSQAVGKA